MAFRQALWRRGVSLGIRTLPVIVKCRWLACRCAQTQRR